MFLTHFLALALVSIPALAQDGPLANLSTLTGTWSSGSKGVVTGPGFANPANLSFIYAKTTGISYSFTDDGFWEGARYRFTGNGTQPNCITGTIIWSHGKYDLLQNGSIVLNSFGDGYQQIQDTCAAVSNFITDFNQTEIMQHWQIFIDSIDGPKLHLYQFDGAPLAPQFLVSATPNMLPTRSLRNNTAPPAGASGVSPQNAIAMNPNAGARRWEAVSAGGVLATLLGVSLLSLAV